MKSCIQKRSINVIQLSKVTMHHRDVLGCNLPMASNDYKGAQLSGVLEFRTSRADE